MEIIEYSHRRSTRKTLGYDVQGASASVIAALPIGTQVRVNATVTEAFDGTTPTITVGTNQTANKFINGQAITAVGGHDSAFMFITTETEREIVAAIAGTDATAGAVSVTVDYTLPTNQEVSY